MEFDLNQSAPLPEEGLKSLHCRLANGHKVIFVCRRFWVYPTAAERLMGQIAVQVEGIRVYSNAETNSERIRLAYEFRLGKDFELGGIYGFWEWLRALIDSRSLFDFDNLDDLMTEFALELEKASSEADNAVAHYEHLPELTLPDEFDQWDDSIFNDQEDHEGSNR